MPARAVPTAETPAAVLPVRTRSHLWVGVVGAVLIIGATITIWYVLSSRQAPPERLLEAAFERLDRPDDPAAWESSRRLAQRVHATRYRDPVFPGATEFILGVVATRNAKTDLDRVRRLTLAVELLREAEQQGLDDLRRPQWATALGTSLYDLGQKAAARPILEEAWMTDPAGKAEVGFALAELELDDAVEGVSERASSLLSELETLELDPEQLRRLISLRIRLAFEEGKLKDAERDLTRLGDGDDPADRAEAALLRAELCLAQDRLEDARRWLQPIAFPSSIETDAAHVATAAYLLGRCDERRGDIAAATRAYERAANTAPESADGTVAALAAARLLQQTGRDEEALSLFRQAIASQAMVEPTPLPRNEFRQALRNAWDHWIEGGAFDSAVELAALSESVLGREESVDLQARGREKAAEQIEHEWQTSVETSRQELEADRLEKWRASGAAYRELATVVTDSSQVSSALRTAAEHFRRAHAFNDAHGVLTDLVELRAGRLHATALVARGRTRLDLHQPELAAEDFETVLEEHPTDPEAFQARYLLGRCHLDGGDPTKAESVWRELLSLSELTPDAAEWRAALFALAELLYRRGVAALARADTDEDPESWGAKALLPLDEAIARFDEFLRRAPTDLQAPKARVLRADAMRRRAGLSLRRAEVAETENLRDADRRDADRLLSESLTELRKAQEALVPLADDDRLPPLGHELLRTTFFDLGHTYGAMRRDREAVVAYGAAVNRYPDDPRVIAAFLRMAECHRRLGRPDDARASFEQARLLLEQIPATALAGGASALSRDDWETWLVRLRESGAANGNP